MQSPSDGKIKDFARVTTGGSEPEVVDRCCKRDRHAKRRERKLAASGASFSGPSVPVLASTMSAKSLKLTGAARWLTGTVLLTATIFASAPGIAFPVLCVVVSLPFLAIAILRLLALTYIDRLPAEQEAERVALTTDKSNLPNYAVLVPLYRETEVIDQLVEALLAVDYPHDRLQISLIVEEHDLPTREALRKQNLPRHMRVVVVPPGEPQTKPRALNYALQDAVGDYVVVYDAEDIPDPDQLQRALSVFRASSGSGNVGCVQARLGLYNPHASLLSRQFTIEYNALFGALLPILAHWRLPVPLGGTSNHFPRSILTEAGGWDAYNVTEDADLGIRLARLGYEVRVLSSTTWEEAPEGLGVWLRQRTRWLKGWMQTYLVHMREPRRLWREMGTWPFFALLTLMLAMLFSALLHPVFYVILAVNLAQSSVATGDWSVSGPNILLGLGIANLIVGYFSAIALGAFAVRRLPQIRDLAWHALLMPAYWLLISLAGYRALWQLATDPFAWEKTPHQGRKKP